LIHGTFIQVGADLIRIYSICVCLEVEIRISVSCAIAPGLVVSERQFEEGRLRSGIHRQLGELRR